MYKGIFWKTGSGLAAVKVKCGRGGAGLEPAEYSSKSGENFNHKLEWNKLPRSVTGGKPYNFYPRGRVEIRNGRATVWLNPALNTPEMIETIKKEFDLQDGEIKIEIKNDNSKHYGYEDCF